MLNIPTTISHSLQRRVVVFVLLSLLGISAAVSQTDNNACFNHARSMGDQQYASGNYEKALAYYMEAVSCAPTQTDEAFETRLDVCRRMVEFRKCNVTINSKPNNAVVRINNRKIGRTPLSVNLDTGVYKLKIHSSAVQTKNVREKLPIFSGGSMNVMRNLYTRSYGRSGVSPVGGWWFTITGSINSYSGWDLGFRFGQQVHEVVGWYIGGATVFNQYYFDTNVGLSIRLAPNTFENWAMMVGTGYRFYDYGEFSTPHNMDFAIGVMRKPYDGGLALTFEFSYMRGILSEAQGIEFRLGIGWGASE